MKVESGPIGPIVIDTNVWISGWLSPQGAPARVSRQVLQRGEPVFSQPTFAELQERLWRPKFDRYVTIELRQRLLLFVNAIARWVDVSAEVEPQRYCRDRDDDKFIHAALVADAHWLVSGNDDLLVLRRVGEIRIVNPSAALKAFESSPAAK